MNKNDKFYQVGFIIGEILALPFKLVLGCANVVVVGLVIVVALATMALCVLPVLLPLMW